MPHQKGIKSVAQNRKAWHDYFVEEKYECGLALFGTEVKSIRQGRVNLKESWAQIRGGEIWVEGMHISPYDQGNIFNRDPMRPKKLLMHKSEIRKLDGLVSRQGYTLVPLEIYLKDGRMKLQLGLCRGKAEHDKRDTIAKRDADRDIRRALREHNKCPQHKQCPYDKGTGNLTSYCNFPPKAAWESPRRRGQGGDRKAPCRSRRSETSCNKRNQATKNY